MHGLKISSSNGEGRRLSTRTDAQPVNTGKDYPASVHLTAGAAEQFIAAQAQARMLVDVRAIRLRCHRAETARMTALPSPTDGRGAAQQAAARLPGPGAT